MNTQVSIESNKVLINGTPTYEGVSYEGIPVEGLLFNSRMVQAIVDDENPETRLLWRYPDTGSWDPERNTDELCRQMPEYRRHGLLAITVGLQGGGSIYTPEVWDRCVFSAFDERGELKPAYANRLMRVLRAADECGMVVIANYFYWKQVRHLAGEPAIRRSIETATDWILRTGFENVVVDLANECADWWGCPALEPANIHRMIDLARSVTLNGRRLLVGCSTGGNNDATPRWLDAEDVSLPHGNGNSPDQLRAKLRRLKSSDSFRRRPRPIVVNEDGVDLDNLDAALSEYASWGFFAQGAGSQNPDYEAVWRRKDREARYEDLSGFQTLPINWSINTDLKKRFFARIREITQGK